MIRQLRASDPTLPRPPAPAPVAITRAHPLALAAARQLLRPSQRLHVAADGSLLLLNVTPAPMPWARPVS